MELCYFYSFCVLTLLVRHQKGNLSIRKYSYPVIVKCFEGPGLKLGKRGIIQMLTVVSSFLMLNFLIFRDEFING